MTAISTKASALIDKGTRKHAPPPREALPPSVSEKEAKSRFVSAIDKGMETLLGRGHGRDRASAELLNEIVDGCSPDEDEIFQTMETLGISLEDATKVMTVSSAFRKAQATNGSYVIKAIDEMTSRLNLSDLSLRGGRSRSSSPSPTAASVPSTPSTLKMSEVSRSESIDSFQTRPSSMAKKGQRPVRAVKSHQQGRGRKRALAEKTPESSQANVMLEEPKKKAAAASDLVVKEKLLNAKLSKAEAKKPKSSARAKSPEGLGARGKRAATVIHVEDSQAIKRPRTRSQTEESIPDILP